MSARGLVGRCGHLARRFATSLSRRPLPPSDLLWAASWLGAAELGLWRDMPVADQRHSVEVASRFAELRRGATSAEMAGALLHDVGKSPSGLGTFGRVIATIVGPRTKRFRQYHDHERLGAEMASAAGSDPITVALITGIGPASADLRAADDSI